MDLPPPPGGDARLHALTLSVASCAVRIVTALPPHHMAPKSAAAAAKPIIVSAEADATSGERAPPSRGTHMRADAPRIVAARIGASSSTGLPTRARARNADAPMR